MLYMVQAVQQPIIRSYKLYIQHRALFVRPLLLAAVILHFFHHSGSYQYRSDKRPMLYVQFWAPDDWRWYRLKNVEHFEEINKLCNVASCWLYLRILMDMYFRMQRRTVKQNWACQESNKSAQQPDFEWKYFGRKKEKNISYGDRKHF